MIDLDIFYNFAEEAKSAMKRNDVSYSEFTIDKDTVDFYCNLARKSIDTSRVSIGGHKIKFSYCSWREMFFKSSNCNDLDWFKDLYCNTGAMCFTQYNSVSKEYDYIIALNSDVFDNLIDQFYQLSLAHEMGHCLLDHPSNLVQDRDINRELAADNAGYEYLFSNSKMKKSDFEPEMVGRIGFTTKHIIACPAMIYGEDNLQAIERFYPDRKLLSIKKEITYHYLNMGNGETDEEDLIREKNFKEFLSK